MLFFTRWKAIAILLTALVVCLFAVPNFFSETTVKKWPSWAQSLAQRHVVLGLDLQGGSPLLRQARIPFTGRAVVGNAVQVHITRDTDVDSAMTKLRELSVPLSGLLGASG